MCDAFTRDDIKINSIVKFDNGIIQAKGTITKIVKHTAYAKANGDDTRFIVRTESNTETIISFSEIKCCCKKG